MSKLVTVKYIEQNSEAFIKLGVANGVGSANHWSKGIYQYYLKTKLNRSKSFFFKASVIHDVLYYSGNTKPERRRADILFLQYMFKLINEKVVTWRLDKLLMYGAIAMFYYIIVRRMGKKAFNWGTKKNRQDLNKILQEDGKKEEQIQASNPAPGV